MPMSEYCRNIYQYALIVYTSMCHIAHIYDCTYTWSHHNYDPTGHIMYYIYGLDRIKRAGAIMLDIKCVCIYKYRAMYNNNIVI